MSDQNSTPVQFGVIGGSGVYQMQGVEVVAEHDLSTPFGRPSDPVVEAQVVGRSVFFLPRHGKGHRYTPSEVPYQANVHV
ncbi:MAG: S-methyl-5'-thioadenosine phosphorylase, partial [Candidatus Latescibacteria bacterium]|nr:S-methyl-5'-thioadenosine phosphorylase [Candidatus Latescibacterota bacterium]